MRLLILLILFPFLSQAQIIRANAFYRPTSAGCSPSLILDQYNGGTAGYSLRKLYCTYSGSAIRVRESGSNTESDIGFTANGDLDTATLKTFCGSNSGYVVTWYSQIGSENATQATQSKQPRIVNAGVVERFNGKPTIYFIKSSSTELNTTNALFTGSSSRSMWAVYKPNTTTSQVYAICGQSQGTTTGTWFVLQFRSLFATGDPYLAGYSADLTGNDAITTDAKIAAADYDGTTGILYKNDGTEQSAARSYNTANRPFRIGRSEDGTSEYCEGFISEIIVWGNSQSSNKSPIFSNINTYYSIY